MATRPTIHAVLTGDIVNSTQLSPAMEKSFFNAIGAVLSPNPYEYYRGDSFQAYLENHMDALRIALLSRTTAISFTEDHESACYDARISIGIGTVKKPIKTLGEAKGEAFLLSGRAFDEMQKEDTRLSIVTADQLVNTGLKILADYINFIYAGMTAKQAQVISGLLAGQTQLKLAEELDKSKSTIHQLATAGKWPEIERQLQRFEDLINYIL